LRPAFLLLPEFLAPDEFFPLEFLEFLEFDFGWDGGGGGGGGSGGGGALVICDGALDICDGALVICEGGRPLFCATELDEGDDNESKRLNADAGVCPDAPITPIARDSADTTIGSAKSMLL
jgi:hypothetical protein